MYMGPGLGGPLGAIDTAGVGLGQPTLALFTLIRDALPEIRARSETTTRNNQHERKHVPANLALLATCTRVLRRRALRDNILENHRFLFVSRGGRNGRAEPSPLSDRFQMDRRRLDHQRRQFPEVCPLPPSTDPILRTPIVAHPLTGCRP